MSKAKPSGKVLENGDVVCSGCGFIIQKNKMHFKEECERMQKYWLKS